MFKHLAGGLLASSVLASVALGGGAATTFDGALIQGDTVGSSGDIFNQFTEVVDPDSPEYVYRLPSSPLSGFYIDFSDDNVLFNFSTVGDIGLVFAQPVEWVFTDVDDSLADFESVVLADSVGDDIDWGLLGLEVIDADSFSIDFSLVSGLPSFVSQGDFFELEISFVPAPAATPVIVAGLALGRRRRRG